MIHAILVVIAPLMIMIIKLRYPVPSDRRLNFAFRR